VFVLRVCVGNCWFCSCDLLQGSRTFDSDSDCDSIWVDSNHWSLQTTRIEKKTVPGEKPSGCIFHRYITKEVTASRRFIRRRTLFGRWRRMQKRVKM